MKKFDTLYKDVLNEYKVVKQFTTKVGDLRPKTLADEKENQIKLNNFKKIVKKLNGTTRRDKCARDIHDKVIQNRDNDVQTTTIEVEE